MQTVVSSDGASDGPADVASDALAVQCLIDLVATQSLSGHEGQVAVRLCEWMERLGLTASLDDAGNAIGQRGPDGASRTIVLLGHMDTVPGDIPVRVEGDVLHGRGTVDAKGPLATCLWAAARCELPSDTRIVVIGAVEEETATSRGAREVVDRYRPSACIIGEPSGVYGVTLGYKGRVVVRAVAELETVHTAAARGSSMDMLWRFWRGVLEGVEQLNGAGMGASGAGGGGGAGLAVAGGAFDSIQASIRSWSSSSDGMLERAELEAGFRLPPRVSPADIEALCRRIGAESGNSAGSASPQAAGTSGALGELQLAFTGRESAVCSPRHDACAVALSDAIRSRGQRPVLKVKTGTCDMNVVGPVWKCPIVAYGPGDSGLDHTPREHARVSEYLEAIGVLAEALEKL